MNMVAEGVKTATTVRHLAKRHGVPMPVCEEIYKVVNGRTSLRRLRRPAPPPRPRERPGLTGVESRAGRTGCCRRSPPSDTRQLPVRDDRTGSP